MAKIVPIKSDKAYQLKITLDHVKPAIWRRFVVPADMKLPDLHKVIQTVMGWYNSHLHQFRIGGKFYSAPDEDAIAEYLDYRKVALNGVVKAEKGKFFYDYDFGDGWEHTLVLEKILDAATAGKIPRCVGGKRNVPPEDCGGVGGYEDIVALMTRPGGEEYEEMIEWLGGEYDPEAFDIDLINGMLEEKDYGCVDLFE